VSNRKLQSRNARGNTAEAAASLVSSLRAIEAALDVGDRDALTRAAHEAVEAAHELNVFGGSDGTDNGSSMHDDRGNSPEVTTRAAFDAGLTIKRSQKGERHDARRVPTGMTYEHGRIFQEPPEMLQRMSIAPDDRDDLMARSIVDTISEWRQYEMLGVFRSKVEAAFEGVFGYPYGEGWRSELVEELDAARVARVEMQQRAARGLPPRQRFPSWLVSLVGDRLGSGLNVPATGEQIHARLAESHDLPSELTAERIESMLSDVGARGGKKAETVVRAFTDGLRKGRGNSGS
jgi:hypothetical protein